MKRIPMSCAVMPFLVAVLFGFSWAQCPEDTIDLGICDTLHVEPWAHTDTCFDGLCINNPGSQFPCFLFVSLFVTHDSNTFWWEALPPRWMQDSIQIFVVPLTFWHELDGVGGEVIFPTTQNLNNTKMDPGSPLFPKSIFRHIVDENGDTIYNRFAQMSAEGLPEWTAIMNTDTLSINGDSGHVFLSLLAYPPECRRWWEGSRVLLATYTFKVSDSMYVYLDSTFWPPGSNLSFFRYDAWGYIPRHTLPCSIWVAPPPSPPPCEDIALHPGWQWISTSVDPDPCKMESIFVNCWGDLDIVKACDGSFCIPGGGCWIDCWKVSEMYTVHMADTCTIEICGSKAPVNKPCPLPQGWNCIAYFPECPLEPEFALSSIWSKLDIVKNDQGEFCIPGVGCWIDCLEYNEGYKVHLASADTLIYPDSCPPCPPAFAKKNSFPGFAKTTHFNYLGNTEESYSIVVNSIDLNGKSPQIGDEIGVFTPSGLCVGGGVWQGEILGMAVWQNDDRTKTTDGFQVGEQMIFKLWDKRQNKEIELSPNFEKGDGRFGTNAYALVNLEGVSSPLPEKFELAQNYPNPFNPETEIRFAVPVACRVQIKIFNVAGQLVKVYQGDYPAGVHLLTWDGTNMKGEDVASGIYLYRMEAGNFTQQKKMVLMR